MTQPDLNEQIPSSYIFLFSVVTFLLVCLQDTFISHKKKTKREEKRIKKISKADTKEEIIINLFKYCRMFCRREYEKI